MAIWTLGGGGRRQPGRYILYHTLLGAGAGAGDLDMLVVLNEKITGIRSFPKSTNNIPFQNCQQKTT